MLQKLNPADHFTLMMDHEIRKSGLAGNFCGIVLELDRIPRIDVLKERCDQFARRFPRSTARLRKTGKQYSWLMDDQHSLPLFIHEQPTDGTDVFLDVVNKVADPFEAAPVEIHVLKEGDKARLILRWFHPASDAKGAELILHHIFSGDSGETPEEVSAIDALLEKWSLWEKIKLGFKAKRQIDVLDKQCSRMVVDDNPVSASGLQIELIRFDEQQSQQILDQAKKQVGLTGTSLYFIGCLMRAMEHLGNPAAGDAYCVPYAMNLRRRKSVFPVFGNQVSFLFSQAGRDIVRSRDTLFAHLKEQNKQSIKTAADRAMLPLMQAASWLTLEKHGQIVRNTNQGKERSSFWFSYTGGMDPEPGDIAESNITGMYQFSLVTAPPSIGILVNNFQGRIVISLNYIQNHFSETDMQTLKTVMSEELLAQQVSG